MSLSTSESLSFSHSLKPRAVEEWLDFYFFRRCAHFFVPLFIKMKMTPNQVSFLSLMTGLLSAFFLAKRAFVIFGALALFAIVLDCCDGQVARLRGLTSPIGRVLDGVCDLTWVTGYWLVFNHLNILPKTGIPHSFLFMVIAAASMIIHCWRFDGVKIRYLELTQPDFSEKDLDLADAVHLMKSSFKKGNLFVSFLGLAMAFQMYFFVRGTQKKEKKILSLLELEKNRKHLDPIMNYWSWLGESHHNVWMIGGIMLVPVSPYFVFLSLGVLGLILNVWWIGGEIQWKRALSSITKEAP
jgi:phosphatidylglycerophosphate synthase